MKMMDPKPKIESNICCVFKLNTNPCFIVLIMHIIVIFTEFDEVLEFCFSEKSI